MAEPIDLPFGLWTRVGRRKHKFNHIRQVAPMCPDGRAHWRQLANTIEPSTPSAAAMRSCVKITLTTYYYYYSFAPARGSRLRCSQRVAVTNHHVSGRS